MLLLATIILTFALYAGNSYGQNEFQKFCYFTGWPYRTNGIQISPDDLAASALYCTHYLFAFAVYNEEKNTLMYRIDVNEDLVPKLMELKSQGKKIIILVGGIRDSTVKYHDMLSNPVKRQEFAKNVVQFMKERNYDGCEFQFMHPTEWQGPKIKDPPGTVVANQFPEDKANFGLFLAEVRHELNLLKDAGIVLEMGIGTNANSLMIDQAYDVPNIMPSIDWLSAIVFNLDFFGIDGSTHVVSVFEGKIDSQIESVKDVISHWMEKGATAGKIIMVTPGYGLRYTLDSNTATEINAPAKFVYNEAYFETVPYITPQNGWTVKNIANVSTISWNDDDWFAFEDLKDKAQRASYVKELKLLGAGLYALNYDCFQGQDNPCNNRFELIRAISDELDKK